MEMSFSFGHDGRVAVSVEKLVVDDNQLPAFGTFHHDAAMIIVALKHPKLCAEKPEQQWCCCQRRDERWLSKRK